MLDGVGDDVADQRSPSPEAERLLGEFLARTKPGESFEKFAARHASVERDLRQLHADWLRLERLRGLASPVREPAPSIQAPSKRTPQSGDSLGPFRIERELGRGGMGIVFQATESETGKRVALKLLARADEGADRIGQRFQREARLAASISHPNCVYVYGAYDFEGTPAIAMELMSGRTLQDVIASDARTTVEQAVDWILQVIDGLEAALSAGVLHRDVTPSNCFFSDDGQVKVGDFGLSRSLSGDGRLTISGVFVGTPLYASPEQVRGREFDARSDMFAVGATLHAVLAKAPPFRGATLGETLARITGEAPEPLRASRPDVPVALERVILRCLEKQPERRFQSYAELRAALLRFVPRGWVPARIGRRFWAAAIDLFIAELALQAVLALAWWIEVPEVVWDSEFVSFDAPHWGAWLPCYLLYFGVAEQCFETTPGKRLLRLRVVDKAGLRAGRLALLARGVLFSGLLAFAFGFLDTEWGIVMLG